jgi:hypothetical protein
MVVGVMSVQEEDEGVVGGLLLVDPTDSEANRGQSKVCSTQRILPPFGIVGTLCGRREPMSERSFSF